MSDKALTIHVYGHVQGVGFRYFTAKKAQSYRLVGYVRNLANGQVEIYIHGAKSAINSFLQWLDEGGPATAKISHYQINESEKRDYSGFTILS